MSGTQVYTDPSKISELIENQNQEVRVGSDFYSERRRIGYKSAFCFYLNEIIRRNNTLETDPSRNLGNLELSFSDFDSHRFLKIKLRHKLEGEFGVIPRIISNFLLTAIFLNRTPVIDLASLNLDRETFFKSQMNRVINNALERISRCDRHLLIIRRNSQLHEPTRHLDKFVNFLRRINGLIEIKFKLPDGSMFEETYDFKQKGEQTVDPFIQRLFDHSKKQWSCEKSNRKKYKMRLRMRELQRTAETTTSAQCDITPVDQGVPGSAAAPLSVAAADSMEVDFVQGDTPPALAPTEQIPVQVQTFEPLGLGDSAEVADILAEMRDPRIQNPAAEPAPKRYRAGTEI